MNRYSLVFLGLYLFTASCKHQPIVAQDQIFDHEIAPYVINWDERKLATTPQYKITGTCGGLPKVNVKTASGFCVGLVDSGEGTIFPRTALEVAPGKIFVVDMGGWAKSKGRLYQLQLTNGKYVRTTLLDAATSSDAKIKTLLDRPHQISKGPDGLIYLSSVSQIVRFDPSVANWQQKIQIVINNIPSLGLHPLKAFTFDNNGNLYINVGSATNVCQKQGVMFQKNSFCPEAEDMNIGQAQIRKYTRLSNGTYSPEFKVYAKGLRNSMGLLWHKTKNILLQVENGRDNIKELNNKISNSNLPHEEFNVIEDGKHYGWPYCYDNNIPNPEWSYIKCDSYAKPYHLLPAHSSPLSMLVYDGAMFPAWYKNRMIISLHGYEPLGHRIVAYLRDDNGLPTKAPFSIVYGWNEDGLQAKGSPVGISQMKDGSLLIVEDKSRKVLRLFYDATQGNGSAVSEIPDTIIEDNTNDTKMIANKEKLTKILSESTPPAFARVQSQMIDKHCIGCHTGADARGLELSPYDFEGNELRIISHGKARQVLSHLQGNAEFALMPPDGFKDAAEKKQMVDLYMLWLKEKGL